MISVIIYARASAECAATAEDQVKHLRAVADSQGWRVARIFTDRPMPMKRGREQRPGEVALMAAIRAGGVDKVLLCSIDRVGRSLPELVGFLEACRTTGAHIYMHDRRIDTATSNGLSLFEVGAMFAQHVRQGRRHRVLRGQQAARGANVTFGRPRIEKAKIERAKALLAMGKGVREVARQSGISPASCSRLRATIGTSGA